jgi:hypothetical protein
MLYNLGNAVDRQDFKEYCNKLYKLGKEKGCWVELSKKRHQRSLPQNSYMHMCIAYFASEYGITLEEAKFEFFKKRYNPELFVRRRKNKQGKVITYIRSSADLDTKEMSIAIESFKNKVAEEFGLSIPDAEDYDALAEAQKQIEMYAEYL